jgi:hypothetical protein
MAQAAAKPSAKPASEPSPGAGNSSTLRFVLGWIVLPGHILAALFLAGVHLGARDPDRGLARLLLKVFGSEPGVIAEPEQPSPPKLRPGAQPGEPFSISTVLQPKQLDAIAEKSLGLSADELDCDHVCRAYFKAEYEVAVYSVEQCELSRAVSYAPSMLICSGKLEGNKQPEQPASKDDASEPPKVDR